MDAQEIWYCAMNLQLFAICGGWEALDYSPQGGNNLTPGSQNKRTLGGQMKGRSPRRHQRHVHAVMIQHCIVLCALYTVLCALCTVHCALCTVHCALCTVYCALCSVLCALCTVHPALCSSTSPAAHETNEPVRSIHLYFPAFTLQAVIRPYTTLQLYITPLYYITTLHHITDLHYSSTM